MPLSKLTIRDAEYLIDGASNTPVFHVFDAHALVQSAGYLKYRNGTARDEGVFFRGETKLHGSLSPGLFRGIRKQRPQSDRIETLKQSISAIRQSNRIFSSFSEFVHEPLLQHYGLKTTWVDLVDNVWVALWFACHKAKATGRISEYLHFEQRTPYKEPNGYAYIILVGADFGRSAYREPGVYSGPTTELVDLRISCPSIFLRPHAQHGLLFRARADNRRPIDYSAQIRGVLRISLADALTWLGSGKMLGIHALFPPPFYDRGYNVLLSSGFIGDSQIGSIAHIGA